jgi:predicted RNase H-like nuclease (RuvC/YqgF family)
LESQHKEARIDAELFRQMSDKENELYEVKIKLIQKENEIIMLNQRVGAIERQAGSLRTETDKLIQISGDLKAQILTFERQKEVEAQKGKMKEYKEQASKVQAQESAAENVKESRLDQLRLEVEQMRDIVNKFKIDGGEQPI